MSNILMQYVYGGTPAVWRCLGQKYVSWLSKVFFGRSPTVIRASRGYKHDARMHTHTHTYTHIHIHTHRLTMSCASRGTVLLWSWRQLTLILAQEVMSSTGSWNTQWVLDHQQSRMTYILTTSHPFISSSLHSYIPPSPLLSYSYILLSFFTFTYLPFYTLCRPFFFFLPSYLSLISSSPYFTLFLLISPFIYILPPLPPLSSPCPVESMCFWGDCG